MSEPRPAPTQHPAPQPSPAASRPNPVSLERSHRPAVAPITPPPEAPVSPDDAPGPAPAPAPPSPAAAAAVSLEAEAVDASVLMEAQKQAAATAVLEKEPEEPSVVEEKPKPAPKGASAANALGALAEVIITIGLMLLLFVFWQLYFTTWEVQGSTNKAVESFVKAIPQAPEEFSDEKRTDPPPDFEPVGYGQTFGTLHVPRWDNMVIPIQEGTDSGVLDKGYAGHYQITQWPGEVGNFVLAGHRRSYGNNFRRVEELQVGDPLIVETKNAWLVYQMTSTEVVTPDNGEVLYPVPHEFGQAPTERLMTLTTCHPEYGSSERFIVYSKLAYWVPRGEGKPTVLKTGKV